MAIVAPTFDSGFTVNEGSNGFVFPLIDSKMSGTAFAPERVFQYERAGTWA
jgi:hypothetical protein